MAEERVVIVASLSDLELFLDRKTGVIDFSKRKKVEVRCRIHRDEILSFCQNQLNFTPGSGKIDIVANDLVLTGPSKIFWIDNLTVNGALNCERKDVWVNGKVELGYGGELKNTTLACEQLKSGGSIKLNVLDALDVHVRDLYCKCTQAAYLEATEICSLGVAQIGTLLVKAGADVDLTPTTDTERKKLMREEILKGRDGSDNDIAELVVREGVARAENLSIGETKASSGAGVELINVTGKYVITTGENTRVDKYNCDITYSETDKLAEVIDHDAKSAKTEMVREIVPYGG